MYMMSRDHLSMHIDASSLQLMLQLLSVDTQTHTQSGRHTSTADDDELARLRHKLLDIVNQSGAHTAVTLDNMTVSLSVRHMYIEY